MIYLFFPTPTESSYEIRDISEVWKYWRCEIFSFWVWKSRGSLSYVSHIVTLFYVLPAGKEQWCGDEKQQVQWHMLWLCVTLGRWLNLLGPFLLHKMRLRSMFSGIDWDDLHEYFDQCLVLPKCLIVN